MATVIIDPKSLSFEEIRTNLISYIQSRPDYAAWRDFFACGAGTSVVELLSGLGTYCSYHSIASRREEYIDTARLYTSVLYICLMLGYAVNRASSPDLILEVTIDEDTVWDRTEPIAYYGTRPISLLYTKMLDHNVVNILDVVMGQWKFSEVTITESKDYLTIFIQDEGIDNNEITKCELLVNGFAVSLVKHSDLLDSESALIRTHPDGVLIVFGDGDLGKKLLVNDVVKFNYIVTEGSLGVLSLTINDISMTVGTLISDPTIVQPGADKDTIQKLSKIAPGYFASRRRQVTGPDHVYVMMGYSGDVISAGCYVTPPPTEATAYISYLFIDEHWITTTEEEAIQTYFINHRVAGEQIILVDPEIIKLSFKATVITKEGVVEPDLKDKIFAIIQEYIMTCGGTFYVGKIINEINNLDEVRRIYVEYPTSDRNLLYHQYVNCDITDLDLFITADPNTVVNINPGGPDAGFDIKPLPPKTVEIESPGPGEIKLDWTKATLVDGYYLYYGYAPGVYTVGPIDVGSVLTYSFTGMASTTYYFVLKSKRGTYLGNYSTEVTITI